MKIMLDFIQLNGKWMKIERVNKKDYNMII